MSYAFSRTISDVVIISFSPECEMGISRWVFDTRCQSGELVLEFENGFTRC